MSTLRRANFRALKAFFTCKKQLKVIAFFGLFLIAFFCLISSTKLYAAKRTLNNNDTNKHLNTQTAIKTTAVINPKKVILLISNKRSGTSLAGHLFSEHPDVFYLFEPLFPFTRDCEILQEDRIDLLQQLVKCEFENLQATYERAFRVTKHSDKFATCQSHNLCFNERHKKLLANYKTKCLEKYGESSSCKFPLKSEILSDLCRNSSIVAFKVIRACSFKNLQKLLEKIQKRKDIDLKILHLIRDPRAILSSRLQLAADETTKHTLQRETKKLCSRMEANVKFADGLWQDATEFSYLRFRFEDLASQYMKVSQNIYQFIGEKFPSEVKKFLLKIITPKKQSAQNPFGMRKRASEVLNSWRKTLTFQEVLMMQANCKTVLQRFGYKVFETQAEQEDMTQTEIF